MADIDIVPKHRSYVWLWIVLTNNPPSLAEAIGRELGRGRPKCHPHP